jgi:subtilisin family serine protease
MKMNVLLKASLCLALVLGLGNIEIQAQTTPTPIQQAIDSLELSNRVEARRKKSLANRQMRRDALHRRAAELNIPLENGKGDLRSIEPDGRPIYDEPDNADSQETTGADRVKEGGDLDLDLTGAGVTIGLWEAGGVPRATHQEFGGRAQIIENVSTTHHATHVAGTIIGAGVGADADAQGFSHEGNLRCYNSADDADEMEDEADDNNLRISSHSYGPAAGWTNGMWTGSHWQFGAYNSDAQTWDEIAFDNPFFTIFKSAGNHRDDTPQGPLPPGQPMDGPYDCITTYSTAKNIITVGAVNAITGGYTGPGDVAVAGFSSWGPTDDGRIKPDIVANGVDLRSATNTGDADYAFDSGTSMATPSASGGAGLILQHWRNSFGGTDPRSSNLKGLIISQADEAGAAVGPDYQMGWGLMNVADAVQMVTFETFDGCRHNIEGNLDEEEAFVYEVHSSGTQPMKVTLTWTDVPSDETNNGTVNPAGVRYLVNDLDLRVTRPDGSVAFPWVLDPANPAAAATIGNNNRDNVEQVLLLTPQAGTYTIRVQAPADLEESTQRFSLWISGNDSDEWDKVVSGQVFTGTQTIAARNNLQVGPDVEVNPSANIRALAGNSVTLKPNFHAKAGSQFLARIMPGGGCGIFSGDLKADNYPGTMARVNERDEHLEPIYVETPATMQPNLDVQPNPFGANFVVQLHLPADEATTLTLCNFTGEVVHTWLSKTPTRTGNYLFDYPADNLPSGIYFVVLNTATYQQAIKVAKVR